MAPLNFKQTYFELFGLPLEFDIDLAELGVRFRKLQGIMHPDRYAGDSPQAQRLAVQSSSFINQAHTVIQQPLQRALYMLELGGIDAQAVTAQQVDGGFLMQQMELRERLESINSLVDPDSVLQHLISEIAGDLSALQLEFSASYQEGKHEQAAAAAVRMQYLDKLMNEAEQIEASLTD